MTTTNRNLIIGLAVGGFILLMCCCALFFAVAVRNYTGGGITSFGPILRGSGRLVTETRDVSGFNEVRVSNAFQVDIIQSDRYRVTVTADDNILPYVQVTQQGQTLNIRLEPGRGFGDMTLQATVEMPTLARLNLSGATRGNISGFPSLADVWLEASGASTLQGSLTAEQATIKLSGASAANLTGAVRDLTLEASGASRVRLGGLVATRANVELSGASSGEVEVTERLDVELSGASSLAYGGGATVGRQDVSGASSLRQR